MSTLNIFLMAFAVLWLYFLWSRRKFYSLYMKFPGPLGYPLLGIAHKLTNREELLYIGLKLENQYGRTFLSWLGPIPYLLVAEPEMAEAILTSPDLLNKSILYGVMGDAIGEGLLTINNPMWKTHRKIINPSFSHKVLLSFMTIFNQESDKLSRDFNQFVEKGEANIYSLIKMCTLNVATRTTMGLEMEIDKTDGLNLFKSIQIILHTIISKVYSPWLRNRFILQMTDKYHPFMKSKKFLKNFIIKLIQERIELKEKTSGDPNIFVNRAFDSVKGGQFSWKDVEEEASNIVSAAYETSANTVGYTIMLLAMFPEYQERAYEDVVSILQSSDDNIFISYDDVEKMTYLKMVLNETMRLIAPAPVIARGATCDVTLSNGLMLPQGTQIIIDIFNMQRDPKIWGPQSTIFNPDNFLPSNMADKHPYAFIPFSKGARNCIGWKYANILTKIMLAKILRKYRFTTKFRYEDLHFAPTITIELKEYPLLEIHSR